MLSYFILSDLNLGINWYLTDNDNGKDGKYTDYFDKSDYTSCDKELLRFLHNCIIDNRRSVDELKNYNVFKGTSMYDKVLRVDDIEALSHLGREARLRERRDWFFNSLETLSDCDLIFCDPDNGIESSKLTYTKAISVKYVYIDEIKQMVNRGKTVICYNHRDRNTKEDYIARFKEIHTQLGDDIKLRILEFKKYSVRNYVFFIQEKHLETVEKQIDNILCDRNWKKFFSEVKI